MILSRILMILALAVLAYLVYITMSSTDVTKKTTATEVSPPPPAAPPASTAEHMSNKNKSFGSKIENFVSSLEQIVYDAVPSLAENKIKYETFAADIGGIADSVHGAAPFGGKMAIDEGDMAKVSYTGLADGTPGDVIQIEGTDLLTAPLVDNMLYTNSIANTNRNASQDLRGDIPLQFNDNYTPFYSSVIYGAPLSQKQMTIGNI
jgi:hypothetical protein